MHYGAASLKLLKIQIIQNVIVSSCISRLNKLFMFVRGLETAHQERWIENSGLANSRCYSMS